MKPHELESGAVYENGKGQCRKILGIDRTFHAGEYETAYYALDGKFKYMTCYCKLQSFATWAKKKVEMEEEQ